MHNERRLKNTPEYRSGMFRIVSCPVCGHPTLDMYWICEHCGWEYDNELQTEDEESPCNGYGPCGIPRIVSSRRNGYGESGKRPLGCKSAPKKYSGDKNDPAEDAQSMTGSVGRLWPSARIIRVSRSG